MQKTDWLQLANAKIPEKRLAALDYACTHKEDYQKELLFWYLRADIAIQAELHCYEALGTAYRALVDTKISEVPYRFSAKVKDAEHESWIRLAASEDAENRMLALEIAKGDPKPYQYFLRIWFMINDLILARNNKARWVIYNLLEAEQIDSLEHRYQLKTAPIFDPNNSFSEFCDEEGYTWQSIVEILKNYQNFSKIVFVKVYRNLSLLSLKEAKDAADKLRFW